MSEIQIRPMREEDVPTAGTLLHAAFEGVALQHKFPPDFDGEFAGQLVGMLYASPAHYAVVAELDGRVVGSNFLSEVSPIRAVGPISVDPGVQARQAGRELMKAVLERGQEAPGIRLCQDSFNMASLSLYAKLGFATREPLIVLRGQVDAEVRPDTVVRPMTPEDWPICGTLCEKVHGFSREAELHHAPPFVQPLVCERGGRLTGYASAPGFWPVNHAVAETAEDLQDLLAGAQEEVSFLLPIRQAKMFEWALKAGLRSVKPMHLMSMGDYREPQGAWLPSVGF